MANPTKYKEEYSRDIIKLGSNGYSKTQMAAEFKVVHTTLDGWVKKYPEFAESLPIALTLAEAYWEKVGQQGTKGLLAKFVPASWIYMMKCRYRENWKDDTNQRIELHNTVKSLSDDELEDALKALVASKEIKKSTNSGGESKIEVH